MGRLARETKKFLAQGMPLVAHNRHGRRSDTPLLGVSCRDYLGRHRLFSPLSPQKRPFTAHFLPCSWHRLRFSYIQYIFTYVRIPHTTTLQTHTPYLPWLISDGNRKRVCLFTAPAGSSINDTDILACSL